MPPAQWALSSAAVVASQPQAAGAEDRAGEKRGSVVSVSAVEGLSSPPNKRSSINIFINQQIEHLRAATEVLLYRDALLHARCRAHLGCRVSRSKRRECWIMHDAS